jgi:hypothetical protein
MYYVCLAEPTRRDKEEEKKSGPARKKNYIIDERAAAAGTSHIEPAGATAIQAIQASAAPPLSPVSKIRDTTWDMDVQKQNKICQNLLLSAFPPVPPRLNASRSSERVMLACLPASFCWLACFLPSRATFFWAFRRGLR